MSSMEFGTHFYGCFLEEALEASSQPADAMCDLDLIGQTELCCVCGDVADGYHYGVRSCRGCNAFFRRAVTYNMQFQCRRGGNCPVDKNARCACRACRLKKCEQMGMDKRAVQPKRDGNGMYNGRRKTGDSESSQTSVDIKPTVNSIASPGSAFTPLNPSDPCRLPIPGTSDEISARAINGSLIARLSYEYQEQKKRRRSMLCSTLEEILSDDCVKEAALRAPATGEDYSHIFKVQMVLMFEWAEKLDEFRQITDAHDKTRLLRAFALRYLLLDNAFHTVELGYPDRLVLVNNAYIKPLDYPPFLPNEDMDSRRVKAMMYGEAGLSLLEELVRPMRENNITTGEMMALRLINFWNPGSVGLTKDAADLATRASNRAVKELHRYYDEERMTDVDTRLGNVLLLLPAISRHTQNLFETVKLIPTFGQMHEWDSFMNDLLKI